MSDSDTFLLLYTYVPDMADRRGPYRDDHLARIRAEQQAGRMTLAGAFGPPPSGGALVFEGVSREDVQQFVDGDPYVAAGLVTEHRIEAWNLV